MVHGCELSAEPNSMPSPNGDIRTQHVSSCCALLHLQCTSPYSYVRTKTVRVVTLPDSQNGYSTVPKAGSPLPCAETSPLAGLCDDSVKAAEVVMSS